MNLQEELQKIRDARADAPPKVNGVVPQNIVFRVRSTGKLSEIGGFDSAARVGDIVFVDAPYHCQTNSVGKILAVGAEGYGKLIVNVGLFKRNFTDWPRNDLWVYPDELHLAYIPS